MNFLCFRSVVLFLTGSFLIGPNLLADQKSTLPGPVIRSVEVTAGEVRLAIDFQIPWSWEGLTFRTRKTFPGFLPGTTTRHQLTFGHFEAGIAEWFITDFIMIGDYRILDPDTVEVDFSTGSRLTGTYDREAHVLQFDGLDYDPYLRVPDFQVLKSHDLIQWEVVEASDQTTSSPIWPAPVIVSLAAPGEGPTFFKVECL